MTEMDTEGITWVGNIYKKFENILLKVEDTLSEGIIYLERQMRIVGESIKRRYSDVKKKFLPLSTCDSDETIAEENVMKMSSSSSVLFENVPSETCNSYNTVAEQGDNKPMQQDGDDDELKLEETCVMVTRNELQLISTKKKGWRHFSLSKKSSRKEEDEELAICHKNNEYRKGDHVESSTSLFELDWELL